MHTVLAAIATVAIWAFLIAHKLLIYYALSVMIGELPMPDATSGKFYRWFFGVANAFAANLRRGTIGVRKLGRGKTNATP